MNDSEWIDVRAQDETSALLSGVSAFAWRDGGEDPFLVVDFIEEADGDKAYSRARVDSVSEEQADNLERALGNPSWFRDVMTDILVKKTVTPLDSDDER